MVVTPPNAIAVQHIYGGSDVEIGAALVSAVADMLVSWSELSALLALFRDLRSEVDAFVPLCFVRQGCRSLDCAAVVGASLAKW